MNNLGASKTITNEKNVGFCSCFCFLLPGCNREKANGAKKNV